MLLVLVVVVLVWCVCVDWWRVGVLVCFCS